MQETGPTGFMFCSSNDWARFLTDGCFSIPMGLALSFDSYFPLIGLAPLVLVMIGLPWLARRREKSLWTPLPYLLRGLALCALVLAFCGPHLSSTREGRRLIFFLLDVSRSIPSREKARALTCIKDCLRRDPEATSHLILFAGEARLVEREIREGSLSDPSLLEKIFWQEKEGAIRSETSLKGAREFPESLRVYDSSLGPPFALVQGLIREGQPAQIFLFTDGNFPEGISENLLSNEIPVHVFPIPGEEWKDALVWKLHHPDSLREGESLTVSLFYESSGCGTGSAKLLLDGKEVGNARFEAVPGKGGSISFPPIPAPRGSHRLEGIIEAEGDLRPENNRVEGMIRVSPPQKVLFLGEENLLSRALALQDIPLEVSDGREEGLDWKAYGGIVLALSESIQEKSLEAESLRSYIEELGGGLLVVAGENGERFRNLCSSGVGALLPLHPLPPEPLPPTPPEKEEEKPKEKETGEEERPKVVKKEGQAASVCLLLLIDKSGSMMGEKLELAKESSIASAEALHPKDLLGVIAFDSLPHWLLQFTEAGDRVTIIDQLARLQASGGTKFYPPLKEAHNALKKVDTRVKHVIFLTDGESDELKDFKEILTEMAEDGITISTVGIGRNFNEAVLGSFAMWGKGKFYPAIDFRSIPQIFTLDVQRVADKVKREEIPEVPDVEKKPPPREEKAPVAGKEPKDAGPAHLFPVWVRNPSPLLAGIEEAGIPGLGGYHLCEEKFLSYSILEVGKGDPLLTAWNFGLGRVLVWASGAEGFWAEEWEKWPEYARLWSRMVKWLKAERFHDPLEPEFSVSAGEDGRGRIAVEWRNSKSLPVRKVLLRFPSGREEEIELKREGKSRAGAGFSSKGETGSFVLSWRGKPRKGPLFGEASLFFSFPAPWELRKPGPCRSLLKELARKGGGRFAPPVQEVLPFPGRPEKERKDVTPLFLLAGLSLFLLDLLARKLAEWM